jgi:ligand-binding SRPBCC domain-containing protein
VTTIFIETRIAAPMDLCFDLARDVDVHIRTSVGNRERAVAGKVSGMLDLGDSVTFEAVHFAVKQQLTSRIVEFDRPRRFVDEMVKGAFSSLRHVHEFSSDGNMTVMTDILVWRSPLGILGVIADKLAVTKHMRSFVTKKQHNLKLYAENLAGTRRRQRRGENPLNANFCTPAPPPLPSGPVCAACGAYRLPN